MEKFSVSGTSDYLTINGFPKQIVELLAGQSQNSIILYVPLVVFVCLIFLSENFVDGSALVRLPNDDINDFKSLIPQTGLRLKLKSLIKNYSSNDAVFQVYQSSHYSVMQFYYRYTMTRDALSIASWIHHFNQLEMQYQTAYKSLMISPPTS